LVGSAGSRAACRSRNCTEGGWSADILERQPVRRRQGFGPEFLDAEALLGRHFGVGRESFGSPRIQTRTDTVASEQTFEGRSPREHRVIAALQGR
jgi:hypothetical protein